MQVSEIGRHAAQRVLDFAEMDAPCTASDYLMRAQAYSTLEEGRRSEAVLRNGIEAFPQNLELVLSLAKLLSLAGRQKEAIPVLEEAQKRIPQPDQCFLKRLGYLYLFDPNKLDLAVSTLQHYLEDHPNDPDTKFNLACAYGQKARSSANGDWDPVSKNKALELLTELTTDPRFASNAPVIKKRIRELIADGQDFQYWRDEPDLQALIK